MNATKTAVLSNARGWLRANALAASLVVLICGIGATLMINQQINIQAERQAEREFHILTESLARDISSRMGTYKQVLLASAGFVENHTDMDALAWRRFHDRLRLSQYYPGIQALGFAVVLGPDELASHTAQMRDKGFPDYDVRPAGERPRYTSIVFVEPFEGSNLAAFGYDMYSNPVRQRAMDRAVAMNTAVLSNVVTLIQGYAESEPQPGLLLYLPTYHHDRPIASVSQRWDALRGFTYSAFRIKDLMAGIQHADTPLMHYSIYDGLTADAHRLVYRSAADELPDDPDALQRRRVVPLLGQNWTIDFQSTDAFHDTLHSIPYGTVLGIGLPVSLLLSLITYLLGTSRDRATRIAEQMTEELRQTERALRLNEEGYKLALDSSSMGTWTWNFETRKFLGDAQLAPLFGYSPNYRFEGGMRAFLQIVHPDDRERVRRELEMAQEGEQEFDTEYRVVWPNGTQRHIASRARVLQLPEQVNPIMTGTCWDVTEKRHNQLMKREFVSTVSHELRTPLTAISGSLGLLLGGAVGTMPDKANQLLRIANENTKRLLRLINDLLDFEKLDAGKLEFSYEVCDGRMLANSAIELNQGLGSRYNVSLALNWPLQTRTLVKVDPMRFQQIMANLLSNAAKYSPPQGLITLSGQQDGERLVFSVRDQGKGIPEEFRDRMFERFSQADSSDTRRAGGTGLGLAICRELALAMGGSIDFDTGPEGTTFHVAFPLEEDPYCF
ncbi:CHASE domain-containing sensor histidine kinase [Isoalcanivorax indicus]|uniref:CHASE domain-containing sensor histidine kinase n=1 Tax=Isoalcanivorax indicus TaxID=2202653 RepID=UPI000DB940B4|nr:CHASE domain-containing protein [Isoalcanivorax indicus]